MSRSLSWINKQKLGSLLQQMGHDAARAKGSATKPSGATGNDPEGTHFPFDQHVQKHNMVGEGAHPPVTRAPTPSVASIQMPAKVHRSCAALLQAQKEWDEHGVLPITSSEASFPLYLSAFVRWLVESTEGQAAFLANDEGLPLASVGTDEHSIAMSSSFAVTEHVLQRTNSLSTNGVLESLIVPLPSGDIWHLGWISSDLGRIAWGLKLSNMLSVPAAESISSMLVAVMNASATH